LEPAQWIAEARTIAEELRNRAILAPDGSATWIAPTRLGAARQDPVAPLDDTLYDGAGGVAVFLATLDAVTRRSEFRSLTLGSLMGARQRLRDPAVAAAAVAETGIGGGSGWGSILYALARVGQLLGDPPVLEDACRAVRLISDQAIAADRQLDVLGGAAGAILGLLAIHAATGDQAALERARACGQHLRGMRASSCSGLRAWRTLDSRMLTGFSHGIAGITYALLRLYQRTGERQFRDAAEEAWTCERTAFLPEIGNWAMEVDGRGAPDVRAMWCYGAPGIALARLGGLPVWETAEIRQEIDRAVEATEAFGAAIGLEDVDHLCCGNFGRIETLAVAAQRRARPDWLAAARAQASRLVARARWAGGFRLLDGASATLYRPSFFQGAAGIGYGLLRLAAPHTVPSVLLWE
ncbi:MAG: type 2 lanthipeptide synthetase LanM, partial [Candidatus Rokuibacteriota bacterium]